MNSGSTVFAQLLSHLPRHTFRKFVDRYQGRYRVRTFSCWDQFIAMAFAQLTGRESLRNIESCLSSQFISVTPASLHDVNLLDVVPVEKDSVVTMDRGYTDFARLYAIHLLPAFFVVRAKSNLRFHRLSSIRSERSREVRGDQVISLVGYKSRTGYPESLRRIAYVDAEKKKRLVFLTNLFNVPPQMIADAYRKRWQVELFFKWIKQHLRIKAFYGTSANAVKTQIWIAVIVHLLVAIVKKRLHLRGSLHTLLQIMEVNLFEKTDIIQVVEKAMRQETALETDNQLNVFTS